VKEIEERKSVCERERRAAREGHDGVGVLSDIDTHTHTRANRHTQTDKHT
jgi:hypothetical protein